MKIRALVYDLHPFFLMFGCVLSIMGSLFVFLLNGIDMGPVPVTGLDTPGAEQALAIGACTGLYVAWYFFLEDNLGWFRAMAKAARRRQTDNEDRLIQSRIKLLEAQIEPHFVLNTMTSIISLQETDKVRAAHMEKTFIGYLKAVLSRTRSGYTRISREKQLLEHYLEIFKIRMDERLWYQIDIEPDVAGLKFPPMLIQPIVENAIKHGLEPKVEGGGIHIGAGKTGNRIWWTICDTGLGFSDTAEFGTGLSNISRRLGHLYGSRARLLIFENQPMGAMVRLEVPSEKI